ncbi:YppG family protein [Bacillus sp. FJAT-50079]|uniref:YppG family protein n=1 Tax=Bacillus sp. FJAT-50079 TaxID=2833577 RepID=UPI0020167EB6|nr:YppG family protein [Bacillus sp. FJAT-50079]
MRRNHYYPYSPAPYPTQQPYFHPGNQYMGMQGYGGMPVNQGMYPPYAAFQMNPTMQYGLSEQGYGLFQNPLQPEEDYLYGNQQKYNQSYGQPYHKPMPGPNQSQLNKKGSFMNSFKSQDGSFDVNKMVNTTGQLVNALTQVSNMAKGLGSFFKV